MQVRAFVVAVALLSGIAVAAHAEGEKPAGTAKGAAVGAVAGHEVGKGHAVAGAATGAAIGHHQEAKADNK